MKTYNPELLISFEETASLSVGTLKTYSYKDIFYETKLAGDEIAEITHMEVKPPEDANLDPAGAIEIRFKPDGVGESLKEPRITVRKDELICPVAEKLNSVDKSLDHTVTPAEIYRFGTGIADAVKEGKKIISALRQTTVKFTNTMDIDVYVKEATTAPFRVNLYGYIYPKDVLNRLGMSVVTTEFRELQREIRRFVTKEMLVISDMWGKLPGGAKQDTPAIYAFARRFMNSATIEKNKNYPLNYTTDAKVATIEEQLFWYPGQIETEIMFISRLGVRYDADLKSVAFEDSRGDLHPSRRIPTALLGYGWAYGCASGRDLPKDFPVPYYTVPKLQYPFSIGGTREESGGIILLSTADISANTIKGVAVGKRVILM